MDVYDFNRLSVPLRGQVVLHQGSKIAERVVKEFMVKLYYLQNFYVEVWLAPTTNQITHVIGFKNTLCLEPYLELIHMPAILK